MGSKAQAQTFFSILWVNLVWLGEFTWTALLLFFIYPVSGVGRAIVTSLAQGVTTTLSGASGFLTWIILFGDFLAGALWLFLRIITPLCWSIVFFVLGIDVPSLLANLFRYAWRLLIFGGIIGTVLAVFTWWGFQNETQQAIDTVYCQLIPLQEPFCNFYNLTADLYETLVPFVNLVLDIVYDFLQMVFQGLVRIVFTGFGLLVRLFGDPAQEAANCAAIDLFFSREPFCVSSGSPNASNQCVIREFYCWILDIFNFVIIDIIGGVLRLFAGNTVANFATNALIGRLEGAILQFDLAISVINPTYFLSCDMSFISLNSTVQQARTCYNDRNKCPQNRLLCYVLFWIRLLFGTFDALCDFVFNAIDVAFSSVFGPIGDNLKRFLRVLSTVIDIFEDPVGWFKEQFDIFIAPVINFLNNLINIQARRITRIITDPRGTIQNLPGVILGIVQDNPTGFAQAIYSQLYNLLGIGGIRNALASLASALSGGGLFGRRRLLFQLDDKVPKLPLIFDDKLLTLARETFGTQNVLPILAAYEIEFKQFKPQCGASEKCIDLLDSYDHFPTNVTHNMLDISFDDTMFCIEQYIKTRIECQTGWNKTTWPDYHLQTGSTWLPEDDYCKPVLERDIFGHLDQLEREQAEHFDDHSWWWDDYASCAKLYGRSFVDEFRRHINGSKIDNTPEGDLYYFERPTTFLTKDMHDPEFRHDQSVAIRLSLLPHRLLPTYRNETVGYKVLRYAQHVRTWFVEYHQRMPAEHAIEQQREAFNMMYERPTTLHKIGEYSMYADKTDPDTGKVTPGLGSIIRPVHDKMAAFQWQKTFGEVLVNWGNTTHLKHIRENAVQVTLAGSLRVAGGIPTIHTSTKYRPWRHINTRPVTRALLQLTPRDFNFNEIIRNAGGFIANVFIVIFKTIAVILRAIGLPGLDTIAMLSEMLVEEIQNFDYAELLDRIVDFALSYIMDLIDSLDCSPPDWYDAQSNPNGPWKCQCLLQLKLPPLVPRWPDFTQITIPWGSPCRAEKGLCGWDGSFPGLEILTGTIDGIPIPIVNQVPCEAGYRDCSEIGFTDGFDILIWLVELVSNETGIDLIGFLRSDEIGIVVGLGLNVAAVALYPIGIFFGFTDTLNDLIGATSLRDLPYVGPVVFRFADFPVFPEGPFYNFCIGWGYALATLPLLITIALFISFGYYAVEATQILVTFFTLFFRAFTLPLAALVSSDTERFKERWDNPVWVYEENPDLYDNEFGAVDYTQVLTADATSSTNIRQRV
jgi:hypothetical protein